MATIKTVRVLFASFLAAFLVLPASAEDDTAAPAPVKHVIHISVDGLRADAVTTMSAEELPNFYRLRQEGAFTDNARTDYDYSNTLPNHTSQLTGRGVFGELGHNWTKNSDPDEGETLHSSKGEYVESVFDVAHDNGRSTALYTTKSKFSVFDNSYNEAHGAPDRVGADNGRDKIDQYVYIDESESLVDEFVRDMSAEAYDYAFLHMRDPDTAGHWSHWDMDEGSSYMESVEHVDHLLGRVIEMVSSTPELAGNTVIILTADHGGGGNWHNHGDASDIRNYTIPFYVWGAGVDRAELYALNRGSRQHPGLKNPGYGADVQPIRNGDAANLALSIMGLPPVPGSMINVAHDLRTYRGGPVQAIADDVQPNDSTRTADADPSGADGPADSNARSGAVPVSIDDADSAAVPAGTQ